MTASVWKLLTLIAFVLMPFGMSGSAGATSRPAPPAMTAMNHCGDRSAPSGHERSPGDCALSCAALPASQEPAAAELMVIICAPPGEPLTQVFAGAPPETATPPPKRS